MSLDGPIPLILLALGAASLTGCSRPKSIDRERARSEIRSVRSFAAEAELSIDFILQGRATRHYAEAHLAYLEEEVEQSAKALENVVAGADAADTVSTCRIELDQIVQELSGIRNANGNRDRLISAKSKIQQIRESLEKANR